MGRPKVEDEFQNELKLFTGLGANGILGFTILQPDGKTDKDLTGLTIKMRIMNALATVEIVAPITGTITSALDGEIEGRYAPCAELFFQVPQERGLANPAGTEHE